MRGLSNSSGLVSAPARSLICICGLASGFTGQMLLPVPSRARADSQRAPFRNDIDMLYFSFTKTAIEEPKRLRHDSSLSGSHTRRTPGCLSPTMISTNGNSFAPLSVTVEVCAFHCFLSPQSEVKRRRRGSVRGFSHEVTREREGVCARDF